MNNDFDKAWNEFVYQVGKSFGVFKVLDWLAKLIYQLVGKRK